MRLQAAPSPPLVCRTIASLIGIASWLGFASPVLPDDRPSASALSVEFRDASLRVLPSVVAVRPAGRLDSPADSGGSGIVVDADRGLILTVDHLVDEVLSIGGSIFVGLPDGRIRPVLDIRRDPGSDLALLAVDPRSLDLRAVDWGDHDQLELGDWVLAVGRRSDADGTLSAGIVGSIGLTLSTRAYRDLIQTDASTGDGNALVDLDGRLVGIGLDPGTIGERFEGIGLAVPSHRARRVSEDLAILGRVRRSAIGVRIGLADPEQTALLEPPGAVLVESVAPEGPAARAGVVPGDWIVSVADRPVTSPDQLISAIEFTPVGEPIAVDILRQARRVTLEVRPESTDPDDPDDAGPIASIAPPSGSTPAPPTNPDERPPPIRLPDPPTSRDPTRFPTIGLRAKAPSIHLAERFDLSPDVSGVVIVGIVPGGPADLGGLSPGMVITDVLDRRVSSLSEFREAIATAPPDADLILRIINRGRSEFRVILREPGPGQGNPIPEAGH